MGFGKTRPATRKDAHKNQSREVLKTLLRDVTFVDYFNIFLNLPVFGQRALFKLHSKTFIFSPPVGTRIHNHRVLDWIQEERYRLFTLTRLAHEYRLCCLLLKVTFSFRFSDNEDDGESPLLLRAFCKNVVGSAAGMYLFRTYLRGTSGARVIACWMHVQAFRKARDPERRLELFTAIRRHYLHPVFTLPGPGCLSDIVATDILNFPVVPTDKMAFKSKLGKSNRVSRQELDPKSSDALIRVQRVLLVALQSYWLPCYLFHVLASQHLDILEKLFRVSPDESVDEQAVKRLVKRCAVFRVSHADQGVAERNNEGEMREEASGSLPAYRSLPSITSFSTVVDQSDVETFYAASQAGTERAGLFDGHTLKESPEQPHTGRSDYDCSTYSFMSSVYRKTAFQGQKELTPDGIFERLTSDDQTEEAISVQSESTLAGTRIRGDDQNAEIIELVREWTLEASSKQVDQYVDIPSVETGSSLVETSSITVEPVGNITSVEASSTVDETSSRTVDKDEDITSAEADLTLDGTSRGTQRAPVEVLSIASTTCTVEGVGVSSSDTEKTRGPDTEQGSRQVLTQEADRCLRSEENDVNASAYTSSPDSSRRELRLFDDSILQRPFTAPARPLYRESLRDREQRDSYQASGGHNSESESRIQRTSGWIEKSTSWTTRHGWSTLVGGIALDRRGLTGVKSAASFAESSESEFSPRRTNQASVVRSYSDIVQTPFLRERSRSAQTPLDQTSKAKSFGSTKQVETSSKQTRSLKHKSSSVSTKSPDDKTTETKTFTDTDTEDEESYTQASTRSDNATHKERNVCATSISTLTRTTTHTTSSSQVEESTSTQTEDTTRSFSMQDIAESGGFQIRTHSPSYPGHLESDISSLTRSANASEKKASESGKSKSMESSTLARSSDEKYTFGSDRTLEELSWTYNSSFLEQPTSLSEKCSAKESDALTFSLPDEETSESQTTTKTQAFTIGSDLTEQVTAESEELPTSLSEKCSAKESDALTFSLPDEETSESQKSTKAFTIGSDLTEQVTTESEEGSYAPSGTTPPPRQGSSGSEVSTAAGTVTPGEVSSQSNKDPSGRESTSTRSLPASVPSASGSSDNAAREGRDDSSAADYNRNAVSGSKTTSESTTSCSNDKNTTNTSESSKNNKFSFPNAEPRSTQSSQPKDSKDSAGSRMLLPEVKAESVNNDSKTFSSLSDSSSSSCLSDTSSCEILLYASSSLLSLESLEWDSDTREREEEEEYSDTDTDAGTYTVQSYSSSFTLTSLLPSMEEDCTQNARTKIENNSSKSSTSLPKRPLSGAQHRKAEECETVAQNYIDNKKTQGEKNTPGTTSKKRNPSSAASSFNEVSVGGQSSPFGQEASSVESRERNNNKSGTDEKKKKKTEKPSGIYSVMSLKDKRDRSMELSAKRKMRFHSIFSSCSSCSSTDDEIDSESESESDGDSEEKKVSRKRRREERETASAERREMKRLKKKLGLEEENPEEKEEGEKQEEKVEVVSKAEKARRQRKQYWLIIANLTKVALHDMALQHEEITHLTPFLLHFIFGSRDIAKEDSKTDRRTLCLLACDGFAGSPLRSYLASRGQKLHKMYLDFWVAVRRYLQLRGYCDLADVVSPERGAEFSRLLQQQVHHLAHVFLTDVSEDVSILTNEHKLHLMDDLLNKRQTTLINATQDVVSNVLSIPATQYILHDLHVFHTIVLRAPTAEPPKELTKELPHKRNGSRLPTRVPSATLKLVDRRLKSIALKTFDERRCLSNPWYDEPETEPVLQGDPEKAVDEEGRRVGTLTEDHRMQAFQFLIMINEDIYTTAICDIRDLADMVWSDFGSLHIHNAPAIRNCFLRSLQPYKRLTRKEVSTLSVITDAYLNVHIDSDVNDDDDDEVEKDEVSEKRNNVGFNHHAVTRLQRRRGAVDLPLPPNPKEFDDLLRDEDQRMLFRLFLISKGPGHVDALSFWKAVEDMAVARVASQTVSQAASQAVSDDSMNVGQGNAIRTKYLLGKRRFNLLLDEEYLRSVGADPIVFHSHITAVQSKVKDELEEKWWEEYTQSRPTKKDIAKSRKYSRAKISGKPWTTPGQIESGHTRTKGDSGATRTETESGKVRSRRSSGTKGKEAISGGVRSKRISGTKGKEAIAGTVQSEGSSGKREKEAIAGTVQSEGSSGKREKEAIAGTVQSEGSSGKREKEAIAGKVQSEGSSGKRGKEAIAGTVQSEGSSDTKGKKTIAGTPRTVESSCSTGTEGSSFTDSSSTEQTEKRPRPPSVTFSSHNVALADAECSVSWGWHTYDVSVSTPDLFDEELDASALFQESRVAGENESVKRKPEQQAPGKREADKKASGKRASDKQMSGQRASAEEASGKRASDEQDSGKQASDEQASGKRASNEQASGKRASDEQDSGKQASDEQPSGKRASDEQASGKRASDKQASGKRASDEQASGKQASDEQASGKQASDEQASGKREHDKRESAKSMAMGSKMTSTKVLSIQPEEEEPELTLPAEQEDEDDDKDDEGEEEDTEEEEEGEEEGEKKGGKKALGKKRQDKKRVAVLQKKRTDKNKKKQEPRSPVEKGVKESHGRTKVKKGEEKKQVKKNLKIEHKMVVAEPSVNEDEHQKGNVMNYKNLHLNMDGLSLSPTGTVQTTGVKKKTDFEADDDNSKSGKKKRVRSPSTSDTRGKKGKTKEDDEERQKRRKKLLYKWFRCARLINNFQTAMRDPLEFRMYEDFLKKEVGNVAENNEKTIHVAGIEGPVYTRTMTKTCTIVVNKLPADLRFCIEVDKFRDQIRAAKAVKQELHLDEVPNREFLEQRSTTIVSCFLNSNIPPAVQINITDQDAARIHAGFGKAKVKMALFHYPFFRIMPILIRMWKKFRFMTVFYGKQQKLNLLEKPTKKVLPHCNIPTIDYTLSTVLDYKYIFVEEGGSRGNSLSPVAPAARATSISQEGGSETQGKEGKQNQLLFSLVTGINVVVHQQQKARQNRERKKAALQDVKEDTKGKKAALEDVKEDTKGKKAALEDVKEEDTKGKEEEEEEKKNKEGEKKGQYMRNNNAKRKHSKNAEAERKGKEGEKKNKEEEKNKEEKKKNREEEKKKEEKNTKEEEKKNKEEEKKKKEEKNTKEEEKKNKEEEKKKKEEKNTKEEEKKNKEEEKKNKEEKNTKEEEKKNKEEEKKNKEEKNTKEEEKKNKEEEKKNKEEKNTKEEEKKNKEEEKKNKEEKNTKEEEKKNKEEEKKNKEEKNTKEEEKKNKEEGKKNKKTLTFSKTPKEIEKFGQLQQDEAERALSPSKDKGDKKTKVIPFSKKPKAGIFPPVRVMPGVSFVLRNCKDPWSPGCQGLEFAFKRLNELEPLEKDAVEGMDGFMPVFDDAGRVLRYIPQPRRSGGKRERRQGSPTAMIKKFRYRPNPSEQSSNWLGETWDAMLKREATEKKKREREYREENKRRMREGSEEENSWKGKSPDFSPRKEQGVKGRGFKDKAFREYPLQPSLPTKNERKTTVETARESRWRGESQDSRSRKETAQGGREREYRDKAQREDSPPQRNNERKRTVGSKGESSSNGTSQDSRSRKETAQGGREREYRDKAQREDSPPQRNNERKRTVGSKGESSSKGTSQDSRSRKETAQGGREREYRDKAQREDSPPQRNNERKRTVGNKGESSSKGTSQDSRSRKETAQGGREREYRDKAQREDSPPQRNNERKRTVGSKGESSSKGTSQDSRSRKETAQGGREREYRDKAQREDSPPQRNNERKRTVGSKGESSSKGTSQDSRSRKETAQGGREREYRDKAQREDSPPQRNNERKRTVGSKGESSSKGTSQDSRSRRGKTQGVREREYRDNAQRVDSPPHRDNERKRTEGSKGESSGRGESQDSRPRKEKAQGGREREYGDKAQRADSPRNNERKKTKGSKGESSGRGESQDYRPRKEKAQGGREREYGDKAQRADSPRNNERKKTKGSKGESSGRGESQDYRPRKEKAQGGREREYGDKAQRADSPRYNERKKTKGSKGDSSGRGESQDSRPRKEKAQGGREREHRDKAQRADSPRKNERKRKEGRAGWSSGRKKNQNSSPWKEKGKEGRGGLESTKRQKDPKEKKPKKEKEANKERSNKDKGPKKDMGDRVFNREKTDSKEKTPRKEKTSKTPIGVKGQTLPKMNKKLNEKIKSIEKARRDHRLKEKQEKKKTEKYVKGKKGKKSKFADNKAFPTHGHKEKGYPPRRLPPISKGGEREEEPVKEMSGEELAKMTLNQKDIHSILEYRNVKLDKLLGPGVTQKALGPLKGAIQLNEAEQSVSRCAEQVSAMVSRLNDQWRCRAVGCKCYLGNEEGRCRRDCACSTKEPGRDKGDEENLRDRGGGDHTSQGEGQRLSKEQVLRRLYEERLRLSIQSSALYILKTENSERERERWSARTRMMVFGNQGKKVTARVTTPEMREAHKQDRPKRKKHSKNSEMQ